MNYTYQTHAANMPEWQMLLNCKCCLMLFCSVQQIQITQINDWARIDVVPASDTITDTVDNYRRFLTVLSKLHRNTICDLGLTAKTSTINIL